MCVDIQRQSDKRASFGTQFNNCSVYDMWEDVLFSVFFIALNW